MLIILLVTRYLHSMYRSLFFCLFVHFFASLSIDRCSKDQTAKQTCTVCPQQQSSLKSNDFFFQPKQHFSFYSRQFRLFFLFGACQWNRTFSAFSKHSITWNKKRKLNDLQSWILINLQNWRQSWHFMCILCHLTCAPMQTLVSMMPSVNCAVTVINAENVQLLCLCYSKSNEASS